MSQHPAAKWQPYWRRKKKKDRRQQSFSFLERPKKAIPAATRRQIAAICEVEGCEKPRQAADHICPIRLAAQSEGDPHDLRNLMAVCVSHNNSKKRAELMLAAGNRLGFLEYLRMRNWPMDRVLAALALYGW